jgi:hypothetical protein
MADKKLLKFNAKKGGITIPPLPQFLKVGRAIAPSSFALDVVLVKFELQIHMIVYLYFKDEKKLKIVKKIMFFF